MELMEWRHRITTEAAGSRGRAVVAGALVPVEWILERLSDGWSVDRVIAEKPGLLVEDVQAALAYATDLLRRNELPALTDEEELGIRAAMDSLRAGRGIPLDEARRRIDDVFKQ